MPLALDEFQAACVAVDPHAPLMVLAGPGSGKTQTLCARVCRYLGPPWHIPPHHVLLLTFTNKAAQQMQDRLRQHLDGCAITVGTIHSICYRILSNHGHRLGYEGRLRIIPPAQQAKLVRDLAQQYSSRFGLDVAVSTRELVQAILSRKEGAPADVHASEEAAALEALVGWCADQYRAALTAEGLLDFTDIITQCTALLATHPDLQQQYSHHYAYVLVDEFQDTSHAQLAFLNALLHTNCSLTVVGDADQSIYAFRGAAAQVFDLMQHHFAERRPNPDYNKSQQPLPPPPAPGVVVRRLGVNYRSGPGIVRGAFELIRHNPCDDRCLQRTAAPDSEASDAPQDQRSAPAEAEAVRLVSCRSSREETAFIVHEARRLLQEHHTVAVLCRVQHLLADVGAALRAARVPLARKQRPLCPEVQDVLAYLTLALDACLSKTSAAATLTAAQVDSCVVRLAERLRPGLGPAVLDLLRGGQRQLRAANLRAALEALSSLRRPDAPPAKKRKVAAPAAVSGGGLARCAGFEHFQPAADREALAAAVQGPHWKALRALQQTVAAAAADVTTLPVAEQVRRLCTASPYAEHLAAIKRPLPPSPEAGSRASASDEGSSSSASEDGNDRPRRKSRRPGLQEFVHAARGVGPGPDALAQFLARFPNRATAGTAPTAFGPREALSPGVMATTIHQAKGLEWPVVFLLRCNEGTLPCRVEGGVTSPALEEERRLCYVAMTRAARRVYLTYLDPLGGGLQGSPQPDGPSRFLREVAAGQPAACYAAQLLTGEPPPTTPGPTVPDPSPLLCHPSRTAPLPLGLPVPGRRLGVLRSLGPAPARPFRPPKTVPAADAEDMGSPTSALCGPAAPLACAERPRSAADVVVVSDSDEPPEAEAAAAPAAAPPRPAPRWAAVSLLPGWVGVGRPLTVE